jgi:hypothetical protein
MDPHTGWRANSVLGAVVRGRQATTTRRVEHGVQARAPWQQRRIAR